MRSTVPPLTTWVIMLKRKGQQKRERARALAKRETPRLGDIVDVTDDDGTKVRAIIVGSPRYNPPDSSALGWYMVEVDEA
jgi:ribosomal protein S3AE